MPMSASSASTAAVRSGVSGERTAERTGTESSAAAAVDGLRRPTAPAAWRPAAPARWPGRRRGRRARRAWPARRRPPTGRGRRRPARARRRRRPCRAGRRPAARRCRDAATRPTGPGRTTLAKPSATPETIAVPQSGPMTSTPASCAARLSATSCSTGTPSEKTSTLRPAAMASAASATAYGPGTETIASAEASGGELVQAGADRPLRDGVGGAGRALARGQRGVDGGDRGGQRLVVLGPDGDEQLLGRGVLVRRQAHVGRELEVERRGHRDEHAR